MYPRIKELREDSDLSQSQIAAQLNCSQQAYSNYELGRRDVPSAMLIRIAQLHKTSVDYVLGLTDMRQPYPKSGR